jgi:predicted permease
MAEASADLERTARRLAETYPATNKNYGAKVITFHEAMNGGPIKLVFLLMLGAVGFVLLIACANVANMLLGRAVERTGELSVRAALGASRWRLVRQLLIESIMLSALGGVIGLAIARYGTAAFGDATSNVGRPYWIDFSMNYQVFGYFALLTVLAGIVFGIAPALLASRVNLNETLKGVSRNSAGSRGGYLSGALVVAQFTLAVVLLSGAGLMMRSFLAAQNEFAFIDSEHILTARLNLPKDRYPEPEDRQRFFEKLRTRMANIPGARNVALTLGMPGDGRGVWPAESREHPVADAAKRVRVSGVPVSAGYLTLLGTGLLRGRDFDELDGQPGHETVIVSRLFAARFFGSDDPLGKQVRIYSDGDKPRAWMTVVGVAPDIRQQGIGDEKTDPLIFLPYRFESPSNMALAIRTSGPPAALTAALRREVQQLDADLPLYDAMPLNELFGRGRWYLRVFGSLFLIFAAVAMGMAAVGVYGVMAHAASRRTREIGVRLALGAGTGTILRLVLRRGVAQLGLGLLLGLAAALGVCRLMARLLFGVSPSDPLTFATVAVVLAIVGVTAIWLPARRAASLNPVQALRYE